MQRASCTYNSGKRRQAVIFLMTFVYCKREKKAGRTSEKKDGQKDGRKKSRLFGLRRRLQEERQRRRLMGQEPPCTVQEIPDGRILCYHVDEDYKTAQEQIRQIPQERIWYERELAAELELDQPDMQGGEIEYLVLGLLNGRLGCAARESILIIEPQEKRPLSQDSFFSQDGEKAQQAGLSEEAYQEILRACLADRNHYTILCANPERYEALAKEACEEEGLLLRCIKNLVREYPLGDRLLILNFRPDYRIKPWLLEKDTRCLNVDVQGVVKFLDTIMKNSYNI